jgi:hypothetical protein
MNHYEVRFYADEDDAGKLDDQGQHEVDASDPEQAAVAAAELFDRGDNSLTSGGEWLAAVWQCHPNGPDAEVGRFWVSAVHEVRFTARSLVNRTGA